MRIGISELILVFVVALIVIGPDKLPQYAKKFGEALAAFRKASDEATKEIKEKNIVEPLEEAQRPLREAMEPVEELRGAVEGNLKDVQSSLNRIGKTDRKGKSGAAGKAAQTDNTPKTVEETRTDDRPEAAEETQAEETPEQVQDSPANDTPEEQKGAAGA